MAAAVIEAACRILINARLEHHEMTWTVKVAKRAPTGGTPQGLGAVLEISTPAGTTKTVGNRVSKVVGDPGFELPRGA